MAAVRTESGLNEELQLLVCPRIADIITQTPPDALHPNETVCPIYVVFKYHHNLNKMLVLRCL